MHLRSLILLATMAVVATGCGAKNQPALPGASPAAGVVPPPGATPPSQTETVDRTGPVEPCSQLQDEPRQPPAGSAPLIRCIQIVAHPVNETLIDQATYAYYIKEPTSLPSKDQWAKYDEDAIQKDFWNLWKTGFVDNLWVEVIDEPFTNGVMGKHVVFHVEERPTVKIVDYSGSKKVEQSKIDEKLKEKGIEIRSDSRVDQATIRRVQGVVQELYAEKGFLDATVTPQITELAGGPKLVRLTFEITEGPKVQIRQVIFDGNKAISDGKLRKKLKENKQHSWLSFITSAGTYQEPKMEEDLERVTAFYHEKGYARAQVGTHQLQTMEDSKDGRTRYIRIRIPVDEGPRYRVGNVVVADNKAVKSEFLRPLFKVKEGDFYNQKKFAKGAEKAKDAYGTFGFWEFVPRPDLSFRDLDPKTFKPIVPPVPPIVDVTIHMEEGTQYFVNRITFQGNTTTHDTVVRREMRLLEANVFNTEALKYSVRRINQLGYFKPLEKAEDINVQKTPGVDGKVDVKLKVEEQNRNQLAFGAGVSQFEGFFGQLSFQTSNFLGRGETFGVSAQKGGRAKDYSVSFSEPYLLDRPINAGINVYTREFIFPFQFTQGATGGNLLFGLPLADFTRWFVGYSYEDVRIKNIDPTYLNAADAFLLSESAHRTVSKVSPSIVYNTINAPVFPDSGTRLTAAYDLAGLGGNTSFWQARLEGIHYFKLSNRMSFGGRMQGEYVRPYGKTTTLPIFERFFLGGEYSVRGYDIRSIGPRDPNFGVVLGGNKSLLFNAEYLINVGGPVRLVFFYDAGQVQDIGKPFTMWEPVRRAIPPLTLTSDFLDPNLVFSTLNPVPEPVKIETVGRASAFKTSTGFEVRFFMPVLNVPFRLIGAYNPQRYGILNNDGSLAKRFTFRFAVGTTF